MIPFLLAAAGGYLIAQSRKQDTFADGGRIENRKDDLMLEQSKEISIFDEKRIGEETIINLQKKYIKERDELIKNKVSSQELTDFIKSRISVEYLIENGVLSPVYSYYSYAFQNTPSLGRPYNYQQAIKLAEQINNIDRFDMPIPFYRVLIVPSVIVNIARFTPELGEYLLYTDKEISEEDLKKLGRFEDGGMLYKESFAKGGRTDGGMTKISAKRIANKLMKIDSDIWDELNIESGSQLYADDELQKKYARELEKSGADKMINQVDAKKVMDILEDNNYSSLRQYFIYSGVLGKGKRDVYVDMYNDGGSYMFMNPNLIQPK